MGTPVFIAMLRRPRSDASEMRSDPFWEFGSFGCTGCHRHNLFNPRNARAIDGARLAFAQGGHLGFRLVHLTPPVSIDEREDRLEARWEPIEMPFRYSAAPILIDNAGRTDFDKLRASITSGQRSTWEGRFASAFRGRTRPLPSGIATELMRVFDRMRERADVPDVADDYTGALPSKPPRIDTDRASTLRSLRRAALPARSRNC